MKVAAALSVLVTAICLAFLFWSSPTDPAPSTGRPLNLRADSESPSIPFRLPPKPDDFFYPFTPAPQAGGRPTIVMPSSAAAEAPPCGPEGCPLPTPNRPAASFEERTSWGTAAGVKMPELRPPLGGEEEPAPRSHTVVDGDTLSDLARRYLGAEDRYLEIYQWNSDVLANPDVLPIGQHLRIPPRGRRNPEPAQVIERPLVPVTPSGAP